MDRTVSIRWLFRSGWGIKASFILVLTSMNTVMCLQVNIPRGYGYVEFKMRADAEKALLYMDGVCAELDWELKYFIPSKLYL